MTTYSTETPDDSDGQESAEAGGAVTVEHGQGERTETNVVTEPARTDDNDDASDDNGEDDQSD